MKIYAAEIKLDPKWVRNNDGQTDLKEYLDQWIQGHLGFRGEIVNSAVLEEEEPQNTVAPVDREAVLTSS